MFCTLITIRVVGAVGGGGERGGDLQLLCVLFLCVYSMLRTTFRRLRVLQRHSCWLQCSNFCFLDYFVSVCACVDAHVVRGADAAVDGCLTRDKTPLEEHEDLGTREIALGSSHGGYHFIVKDPAGLS